MVSAKSREDPGDSGVFDREAGRVTLEDGAAVGSVKATAPKSKRGDSKLNQTVVLFGNTGDWRHGAAARMVFEDGTVVDRDLPADASWVRFRIRFHSKLAWAAVDPERRNAWDWNRLNDSKVLGSGKGEARTLGRRAAVKYAGWASFVVGLWTQLLWALA